MILVAARHATPATCTPREKQTRFSKQNKDKRKTKQNYPGFEFKPRQVNDSSQSNQGTDHLVSHIRIKRLIQDFLYVENFAKRRKYPVRISAYMI
jgi:hypothetical protein